MADGTTSLNLLVIWHSRTGASEAMARAACAGPRSILMPASAVTSADILGAAGYLFVCPENLASMSGEMKEMFDRNYYPVLGKIEGRPYASIIAAGSDGEGAQRQLDRIALGWRLKRVADALIVNFAAQTPEAIQASKIVPDKTLKECEELGFALEQGITMGIF